VTKLRVTGFRIEAVVEMLHDGGTLTMAYDGQSMVTIDKDNSLQSIVSHLDADRMQQELRDRLEAEVAEFTNFFGGILRERAEANLGRAGATPGRVEPATGSVNGGKG
jgi:hypothetical protein